MIEKILNDLTVKPNFIHNDFSDFKPGVTHILKTYLIGFPCFLLQYRTI